MYRARLLSALAFLDFANSGTGRRGGGRRATCGSDTRRGRTQPVGRRARDARPVFEATRLHPV